MKSALRQPTLRPFSLDTLAETPTLGGETIAAVEPAPKWFLVDRAASGHITLWAVALSLAALTGCQATKSKPTVDGPAASAPFMTLDQFATALTGTEDVVLVEFCMPSGCARCDAMRGPIDGLANDRRDGLVVRRIDLRQYPQLAWEFKLNACPSYVAFRGGQEVFRAEHPTSADLIGAQLDESFGDPAPEPLAAVTR